MAHLSTLLIGDDARRDDEEELAGSPQGGAWSDGHLFEDIEQSSRRSSVISANTLVSDGQVLSRIFHDFFSSRW